MPNYVERTLKLLELGEIYVIFNGGTGTISEFGMAWGLARLYFGNHKPMVLFGQFLGGDYCRFFPEYAFTIGRDDGL